MMAEQWLSKAKELLEHYVKLQPDATESLHIQFFDLYIPQLNEWIDEFEITGKIPTSGAYEMVMGNE